MSTVTLPDDVDAWARKEVAAGRANSVQDLVAEALREKRMVEGHRVLVEEALLQKDRGEGLDESDMDAIIEAWFAKDAQK